MTAKIENFTDWVPTRVYWRENRPFVDWCYMGDKRFTEPFFDDTIERRFREPFNLLFRHQTPIEFLAEINAHSEIIAPTGFIFHLSRCGSTLISQMLAAVESNIVKSEPPPVDWVLRSDVKNPEISSEQKIEWLKLIIGAFGRKRNPSEKHLFIKFDSWSTIELRLIERAFPDVPWIFLYRNPVEIIVSQIKQRGAQMIPGVVGQILPGFSQADVLTMQPEEYCGRVLARICEHALKALPHRNGSAVNYEQLPEAFDAVISERFRVDFSPEELGQMKLATQFNAKTPQLNFVADSDTKRKEASEAARVAAEKFVDPLYEKLEKMRLQS